MAISLGPSGLTGTQAQVTTERRGGGWGSEAERKGPQTGVWGKGGSWDSQPLPAPSPSIWEPQDLLGVEVLSRVTGG